MFLLKKFIGAWLMPLPFALSLILLALVLRAVGRLRGSRVIAWCGIGIATLATLGSVGNGLLWWLETRYPAIVDVANVHESPDYIVVLGSGYRPRPDLPITSSLDAVAVIRLTEGVRLFREFPQASLVLTGGSVHGHPPSAHGYAKAAEALGVPATSMLIVDDVLDTGAEIRSLRAKLGADATVLLVTSASHMPRAMEHCLSYGIRAVPAPTAHLAEPPATWGLRTWLLPSGVHLRKTEVALHEYVGLLALHFGIS